MYLDQITAGDRVRNYICKDLVHVLVSFPGIFIKVHAGLIV